MRSIITDLVQDAERAIREDFTPDEVTNLNVEVKVNPQHWMDLDLFVCLIEEKQLLTEYDCSRLRSIWWNFNDGASLAERMAFAKVEMLTREFITNELGMSAD